MGSTRSSFGMTDLQSRIAHDIGDVCDRLIDIQLERLSWREPNTREAGAELNKRPASNSEEAAK